METTQFKQVLTPSLVHDGPQGFQLGIKLAGKYGEKINKKKNWPWPIDFRLITRTISGHPLGETEAYGWITSVACINTMGIGPTCTTLRW